MLQIVSPKDLFDAIVVGSGATGGWAAKKLTTSGSSTSGCQNPTLTMMAITVRACDYIQHEYAKQIA
jgi:choline dehydrogenase-like flavoprotein